MSNNENRFKLDSYIFKVPTLIDMKGGAIFFFNSKNDAKEALKYAQTCLSKKENISESDFPDSLNFGKIGKLNK